MRNIDLRSAYSSVYENRMAAMTAGESEGKKMMKSSPAKVSGKGAYTMKGKDGKPLFKEDQQIDEVAPLIAGAVGKMAGAGAAKAATAGAAKAAAGKGLMAKAGKAAGSKMGQRAIGAGANKVQDSVTNSLSDKNEELQMDNDNVSYTAQYMEGYKKLPKHKMQDQAAMKPDTARGEKQARKMDLVRQATNVGPEEVKRAVVGQEMKNRKKGLERKYNAPSADNAAEKSRKNKAYKLEGQRRKDLDKRYGPKKEQAATVFEYLLGEGYTTTEDGTFDFMNHMSDGFFNAILEESLKG